MKALLRPALVACLVVLTPPCMPAGAQCTVANQSPAAASVVQPPVTFQWTFSGGPDPDHFDILWEAVNPPGPPNVASAPGQARQFGPVPLPGGTELQFWVDALNSSNEVLCTSGPARTTFSTEAPPCPQSPPERVAPVNGATGQSNPVHFEWLPVTNATDYVVLVREAGQTQWNPNGPYESTSTDIQLGGAQNWEWYVEARNVENGCPPSPQPGSEAPWSFSLAGCPSAPSLVSPLADQVVASPVMFEWSESPGASFYRLVVRNSGGIVFERDFAGTAAEIPLPDGPLAWLVQAVKEGCPPAESASRPIVVQTTCPTDRRAEPLSPRSGATSPPFVFFEWTEVPGASGYELVYSVDGGPFIGAGMTRLSGMGVALRPGLLRWRVDTTFPGCPPLPSLDTFELKVEAEVDCDQAFATLIRPGAGATVPSPVTFEWSTVSLATLYVVWASFGGQPFSPIAETSTATTLSAPVPSGPIEWFVQTHLPNCPPRNSQSSRFTAQGGAGCDGIARPQLLTPFAGQADVASPVGFSWSKVDPAVAYRIVAMINAEPAGEIGFTTDTSFSRPLPPGRVEWTVEAIIEGCAPTLSEPSTFSSRGESRCPMTGPELTSPAQSSTSSSLVRFTWQPLGVDLLYRVWLARGAEQERVVAETSSPLVEMHLTAGKWAWRVEALRPQCAPVSSASVSFTVTQGSNCEVAAAVNITPANGTADTQPPVTFTWTAVSGALGYEVWIREADGVQHPIGFSATTTLEADLPPGQWTWFVAALLDGCEPVRSAPTSFTIGLTAGCDAPPPFLAHPPVGDGVVMSPRVRFEWTPSAGATSYEVHVSIDRSHPSLLATTSEPYHVAELPEGEIVWHVVAIRPGCPPARSGDARFQVNGKPGSCEPPAPPRAGAVPRAISDVAYPVSWEAVPFAASYEIQESPAEDFASVTTTSSSLLSTTFTHTVTAATSYYYRVRAIPECNAQASLFSNVARVVVEPAIKTLDVQIESVDRIGNTGTLTRTVFMPGGSTSQSFTASTTQSWMTVSPSSGTLPPEGANLTVTIDLSTLPPGASTGQIVLSRGASSRFASSSGSSVPVTVSLVAPVTSTAKSSVRPDSIIVPAVGHAAGLNSQWQSDIRIANLASQSRNFQLFFTPSGTAGTGTVRKASVTIGGGKTIAFNDILKSWYGIGAAGENATGSLEVRPETQSAASAASLATTTIAASRTYNLSTGGTFGQFIPGVAFERFVGKGTKLSLQQLAQSTAYRTNIGVVEGSGEAATIQFTVFDASGTQLDQWSASLLAGEHRQYDRILAQRDITTDSARVEIEVTSDTGMITAYASKVDNLTGDPELITPVIVANVSVTKIVLAGVGDFDNGLASWRTDLRLYNGGSTAVTAALTYYAQGDPGNPASKTISIDAGQVFEMNDLLRSEFGLTNRNGALHVATGSEAQLVATARTYNKTSSGTYGQFIPGIPASQGVGLGGRTLQLMQVEQSPQFRANLGIFEMSGNAVTVEVTAIVPNALAAPSKRYTLQANEFQQINQVLNELGFSEAYNARLTIRVVSGNGTINAYASVVDMSTQDPTYVPAQ
jgi:hypothetical protein